MTTRERIDVQAALAAASAPPPDRRRRMAVNLHVGEAVVMTASGTVISVQFERRHGAAARLIVRAGDEVAITLPER